MNTDNNRQGHQNPQQTTSGTAAATAGVSALLADLTADDITRRQNARSGLVAIGEPALPAMLKLLAHGEFLARWEVTKTLGEMRLPGSVPGLIDALADTEQDVRWLAAVALAGIGREALAPLLEALIDQGDSPYMRQGTHHVLTILEDRELEELLMPVRAALGYLKDDADLVPAAEKALRELTQ